MDLVHLHPQWVKTRQVVELNPTLESVLTINVTLVATTVMGAAAIVLGIDCFTTTGLKEFWLLILGFGALLPFLTHFPFTITIQAELGVMG
ncbi:hypothetical protein VP01_999g7 [Puccinia sorghi]|uniref:TM7S3/TM198-like domain-containing protein n=1 Tax=Puccinia sorghi TaxID=27349 RepID=A0A0L6U582_9BASI|nr:hypothetical protein VP01_999g7 [Puccinia sorghi]